MIIPHWNSYFIKFSYDLMYLKLIMYDLTFGAVFAQDVSHQKNNLKHITSFRMM